MQRGADEIEAAHAQVGQHRAHLRQIADLRIAAMRRAAEDADRPRARRQQAENGAHQCGLAGAVRAEHADEFAGADGQARIGQDGAIAERQRHVIQFDRIHEFGPASAFSVSVTSLSIHCWKVISGGTVSVTPTTGIFAAFAMATRCCTILLEACLL